MVPIKLLFYSSAQNMFPEIQSSWLDHSFPSLTFFPHFGHEFSPMLFKFYLFFKSQFSYLLHNLFWSEFLLCFFFLIHFLFFLLEYITLNTVLIIALTLETVLMSVLRTSLRREQGKYVPILTEIFLTYC